jgi:hypothetical protein
MALELSEHTKQEVNGALAAGRPLVLGYIGEDGYPHLSHRGSTHVHGPQQLAIWGRNPDGGFQRSIADRPEVGLFLFRPGDPPGLLTFRGRARLDPSQNDVVWAATPQGEKDNDPERKGGAVIIDLDSVQGLGPDGFFTMERDA